MTIDASRAEGDASRFPTDSARVRDTARQAVQGPAAALRMTGWLGLLCTLGILAYIVLRIAWLDAPRRTAADRARAEQPPSSSASGNNETNRRRRGEAPEPLPPHLQKADVLYGYCLLAVVFPCWSIIVLSGAKQMRQLGHYEAARIGCVMAMVPLNAAWVCRWDCAGSVCCVGRKSVKALPVLPVVELARSARWRGASHRVQSFP